MWEAIFFYGFAALAVVSALLVVLMKNPVVSAIYLIICFFAIAAFYVMLNAQLLAAFQILIYAGAIMVLFLFVIMLLNLNRTSFTSYKLFFTKLFSLAVIMFILFVVGGYLGDFTKPEGEEVTAPQVGDQYEFNPEKGQHVQTLAKVLFTRYIYPFEIMAIMLLAAIIGAVLLTKKRI